MDLFGTSDSIAVSHIHRGIILETACKSTTSGTLQILGSDFLHGNGFNRVDESGFLSRLNLHFIQHVNGFEDMVVMGRFHHVVDGVVLVTDTAEHETADLIVKRYFIMSVGVGYHAFVDDFPIHIHAWQWRALTVFGLFIYSAFDEALGKGCRGEGE